MEDDAASLTCRDAAAEIIKDRIDERNCVCGSLSTAATNVVWLCSGRSGLGTRPLWRCIGSPLSPARRCWWRVWLTAEPQPGRSRMRGSPTKMSRPRIGLTGRFREDSDNGRRNGRPHRCEIDAVWSVRAIIKKKSCGRHCVGTARASCRERSRCNSAPHIPLRNHVEILEACEIRGVRAGVATISRAIQPR